MGTYAFITVIVLAIAGFVTGEQEPQTVTVRPKSKNKLRIPAKRPIIIKGRYPSQFA